MRASIGAALLTGFLIRPGNSARRDSIEIVPTPRVARPVEPACLSPSDYGWPRFTSASHLRSSPSWAAYFLAVYGAVEEKAYPICVYDFHVLNETAYAEARLDDPSNPDNKYYKVIKTDDRNLEEGDLYSPRYAPTGLQIYHENWVPVPNNTWVEVSHMVFPTELRGMWVWRTRGSGVWANVGRTLVGAACGDGHGRIRRGV